MNSLIFNNARDAFIHGISMIINNGDTYESRLGTCREIRPFSFSILQPSHRLILLTSYHEDILAKLISTIWLVTGTNDISHLRPYLPQVASRSDDGYTWRSAVGSRLRNWDGIDQLLKIVDILTKEPDSRRAVCVLSNPLYDLTPSKDIACTISIQCMIRKNRLEMFINMRSTDVINGLAAHNIFEWTMLQELVASWLKIPMGSFHFYTSSLHLYDSDIAIADEVLHNIEPTPLQSGISVQWSTPPQELDQKLEQFWLFESRLRMNQECDYSIINDTFLEKVLDMVQSCCSSNKNLITDSLWMSALQSHGIHIHTN